MSLASVLPKGEQGGYAHPFCPVIETRYWIESPGVDELCGCTEWRLIRGLYPIQMRRVFILNTATILEACVDAFNPPNSHIFHHNNQVWWMGFAGDRQDVRWIEKGERRFSASVGWYSRSLLLFSNYEKPDWAVRVEIRPFTHRFIYYWDSLSVTLKAYKLLVEECRETPNWSRK